MKRLQFRLEDFNPDSMTEDDINQWIDFIGNGLRPSVAKQWFPDTPGQFRHTRNIRNYLQNKLTAMHLRIEGRISTAMTYEAICERIYNDLPHNARW
jgi:hypothetical protein